jgi:hypothetical protein
MEVRQSPPKILNIQRFIMRYEDVQTALLTPIFGSNPSCYTAEFA